MEKKSMKASMTVEAALLFPFLFLVTFLFVRLTLVQYKAVQERAGILYDAVFPEKELSVTDKIRIADTAFELFQK